LRLFIIEDKARVRGEYVKKVVKPIKGSV
jgi:hypothetical protein